MEDPRLPVVEVRTEEETEHGWRYRVFVETPGAGAAVEHIVLLSWVDHEHWSGGRFPPSKVVERVVQLLVEGDGTGAGVKLPACFDASTARRWLPGLDKAMGEAL
jgi:hypothetical protein